MVLNDLNNEFFAKRLKLAAMSYNQLFSFRVYPIEGNTASGSETDHSSSEQSFKTSVAGQDGISIGKFSPEEYNWGKATGIGVYLGEGNIWALDIDNISQKGSERESLILHILYLLRLPDNYEWVVNSGSGKGIHIIFRSQSIDDSKLENSAIFYNGAKMNAALRMKNAFLVLPPSKHYSGNYYEFKHIAIPSNPPHFVSIDSLFSFFSYYFGVRDVISLSFNHSRVYLIRTGLLKEINYDEYGNYNLYVYNDIVTLLQSCHNPSALNSLGCLLMIQAEKSSTIIERNKILSSAYNCFKEARDEYANNNIKAIDAILDHTPPYFEEPLDFFGDYRYIYLQNHNYKYLFFDTETTGLPKNMNAPYEEFSNWPRLVQLSWLCVDNNGDIIAEGNYYIKPIGYTIPEEATRVHSVSTEKVISEGDDLESVLKKFLDCATYCKYIVGHNIEYDIKIICSEIARLKLTSSIEDWIVDEHDWRIIEPWEWGDPYRTPLTYDKLLESTPIIDTMKESVDYCKIPGLKGYKYPRLQELYLHLFNEGFNDAHNSMVDIKATLKCFNELRTKCIIKE